ncbi:MAG TPA: hypothetical protein VFY80_02230 [Burkholderiales bacterium]|nr:hypothetical protein [Burkholderiales bacterium]
MTTNDKRLAMLSGRMDKEAWTRLYRMQHHPKFGDVLGKLEQITGTITHQHVEAAAQEFVDEPEFQQWLSGRFKP